mgnify:CR=1 FL=1
MLIRKARHLGQMGDAQDLATRAELLQAPADHLGDTASHAAVDFVEDHCRYRAAVAGDDLDGEAHA